MFVVAVSVHVKQENIEDFKEAILANARGARTEPETCASTCCKTRPTRPNSCCTKPTAAKRHEAHQKTAHYLTWRAKAENWMAQPRKGVRFTPLFPENEDQWTA